MSWVACRSVDRSQGQDVVRGQHQDASLGLGFSREREVHCHLVTVEVGVERGTDQRVNLDALPSTRLRLESLDSETVQALAHGSATPGARDDSSKTSHTSGETLDHALRALDVLCVVKVDETLHDERLEQLKRHLLGQTALVQLELRTNHDDRTA